MSALTASAMSPPQPPSSTSLTTTTSNHSHSTPPALLLTCNHHIQPLLPTFGVYEPIQEMVLQQMRNCLTATTKLAICIGQRTSNPSRPDLRNNNNSHLPHFHPPLQLLFFNRSDKFDSFYLLGLTFTSIV